MRGFSQQKKPLSRSSANGKRRWQHHEEIALLEYLKKNRDFEKPCARIYYTRFLFESGIDIDWRLVRCKTRNMRVAYRRAKEYEYKQADSSNCHVDDLRREVLKMCWYVDDFDVLFPIFGDNSISFSDPIFDEELSKEAIFHNDDGFIAEHTNVLNIKKEKQDEDSAIKLQKIEQESSIRGITLKENESKNPLRNRTNPIRKWQRKEELALIAFLKKNCDFEKPTARIYYLKFIEESGIDIEWHLVRSKVRNMRVAYRKAKEHEIREADSNTCDVQALRNDVLKICWFVDEFDIIFPNDMDNSSCLRAYKTPDPIVDDEFSKDETFFNVDSSSRNFTTNFLPEQNSIASSTSSGSTDGDANTWRADMCNLKSRDEILVLRHKEFELAREKLNFEKEKFRQEIRLKEKEIDSEEKLKVMEIQMKERIAIKKLEIEEMLALRAAEKPENSYNSIYHNLI